MNGVNISPSVISEEVSEDEHSHAPNMSLEGLLAGVNDDQENYEITAADVSGDPVAMSSPVAENVSHTTVEVHTPGQVHPNDSGV